MYVEKYHLKEHPTPFGDSCVILLEAHPPDTSVPMVCILAGIRTLTINALFIHSCASIRSKNVLLGVAYTSMNRNKVRTIVHFSRDLFLKSLGESNKNVVPILSNS